MQNPLIISGLQSFKDQFHGNSLFYEDYSYLVSNASMLDVARAIGLARKAPLPSLPSRVAYLEKAAQAFSFHQEHLEHTVKVTGLPIKAVERMYKEIPDILRAGPQILSERFRRTSGLYPLDLEIVTAGLYKIFQPGQGFCYAITPGIDPRASALVAANLTYLGVPFILRASIRDATAPLVIEALLSGGFEASFCSLVYFDKNDPEATSKHFKLLESSSVVWTHGPSREIDRTLRYQSVGKRIAIELEPAEQDAVDKDGPESLWASGTPNKLLSRVHIEDQRVDHFQGKTILRHDSGNCAMIVCGPSDESVYRFLADSLEVASLCTATKSVMLVQDKGWSRAAADSLAGLQPGDPLQDSTQIGYMHPLCLDYLDELATKYRGRVDLKGGERLSPIQARPLLVMGQDEAPEFFEQEIPACVLAIQECSNIAEAIERLNAFSNQEVNRLAVSLVNVPREQLLEPVLTIKARVVLVDQPTTRILPLFHDGNDYTHQLAQPKMLAV